MVLRGCWNPNAHYSGTLVKKNLILLPLRAIHSFHYVWDTVISGNHFKTDRLKRIPNTVVIHTLDLGILFYGSFFTSIFVSNCLAAIFQSEIWIVLGFLKNIFTSSEGGSLKSKSVPTIFYQNETKFCTRKWWFMSQFLSKIAFRAMKFQIRMLGSTLEQKLHSSTVFKIWNSFVIQKSIRYTNTWCLYIAFNYLPRNHFFIWFAISGTFSHSSNGTFLPSFTVYILGQ